MQLEASSKTQLQVKELSVDYKTPMGNVPALRRVSLSVSEGEVLSVVGESGSGKSTLALAVTKLLPPNSVVIGGNVLFRGKDLKKLDTAGMDRLRGTELFMIFQNPFMSLNPLMRIQDQIGEAIRVRNKRARIEQGEERNAAEVAALLESVKIAEGREVMRRYPHQLSGGQNQRVMLAMALAEKPRLLIADEPTTALDVTTQAQVLALLKEIIRKTGMAVIFITHDLAVAGTISDRIAVLYGGMVQELGSAEQVLSDPRHPYTASLIKSIPSKSKSEGQLEAIKGSFSLAEVKNMCAFAPRCPLVHDACKRRVPALIDIGNGRYVRCVNEGEATEDALI